MLGQDQRAHGMALLAIEPQIHIIAAPGEPAIVLTQRFDLHGHLRFLGRHGDLLPLAVLPIASAHLSQDDVSATAAASRAVHEEPVSARGEFRSVLSFRAIIVQVV